MNTPFFISWRYQKGKQKTAVVSLIAWFSTIGIALGVAVLIIGLSAMNGFERELNQRVLSVVPQAEVYAYDGTKEGVIRDPVQLEKLIKQSRNVVATAPFITFTALIENGTQLKIAQVRGIDPQKQEGVSQLGHFVQGNQWSAFKKEGGLILGAGIAKALDVDVGDEVTLLLPQASENERLAQPLRFNLPITGILKLEGQLDYSYALLSMKKHKNC